MGDVVVVGSANLDLVATLPAIPAPGETVLALGRATRAGGKGLNQAVAAARAGVGTILVAAVGSDEAASILLDEAAGAGVDVSLVRRAEGPSGSAWILVRSDGENAIVVDAAANDSLETLLPAERAAVAGAGVVVCQLEVPLSVVAQTAGVVAEGSGRLVLNAAPARALPAGLLETVDVLVVNEHEARTLAEETDVETAAARLRGGDQRVVVVTLGAEGALVVDEEGVRRVGGVRADVVDTTGAGDAFTGHLAACLAAGLGTDEAVRRAVVAGALACETVGAAASSPSAAAVADRRAAIDRSGPRPG